jgi:hypothetical protein
MSSDFFITFTFQNPFVPSELLSQILAGGWSVYRGDDGSTYFVPLGADVGDFESTTLSDATLLKICDEKLARGEVASINIVSQETGGIVVINPPGTEFTLCCDINIRRLAGSRWLDVNWYLERLVNCFDDNLPPLIAVNCNLWQ